MQTKTLGKDLQVSAVGLGCMGFSHAYGAPTESGEAVRLLRRMAQEKQATPAQISLAWMLCKKPWIVPIPGTRKEARMAENAGAAGVALTPAEVAALDQALDRVGMSGVFGVNKN